MVVLNMVLLVFEEEVFVCAITGESDGSNTQAGEETLETVPSGEGAGVPPDLTVGISQRPVNAKHKQRQEHTFGPRGLSWPKPTWQMRRP